MLQILPRLGPAGRGPRAILQEINWQVAGRSGRPIVGEEAFSDKIFASDTSEAVGQFDCCCLFLDSHFALTAYVKLWQSFSLHEHCLVFSHCFFFFFSLSFCFGFWRCIRIRDGLQRSDCKISDLYLLAESRTKSLLLLSS